MYISFFCACQVAGNNKQIFVSLNDITDTYTYLKMCREEVINKFGTAESWKFVTSVVSSIAVK